MKYASYKPEMTHTAEPTTLLKWVDGVLHQAWKETTWRDGRWFSERVEYRPVPSEVTK